MRAVFNTTCDLYFGPRGLFPGVRYATAPCRLVLETVQDPLVPVPWPSRFAYMTIDLVIPAGPQISGSFDLLTTDYGYSDRVAVPSGTTPLYEVIMVEEVTYLSNPTYFRAHLRTLSPLINPGGFTTWLRPSVVGRTVLPRLRSGGFSVVFAMLAPAILGAYPAEWQSPYLVGRNSLVVSSTTFSVVYPHSPAVLPMISDSGWGTPRKPTAAAVPLTSFPNFKPSTFR